MNAVEKAKKTAAIKAVEFVKDGMIVGLGTGSTVKYALKELRRKIKEEDLDIIGIPTSKNTEKLAKMLNIPLGTLDEYDHIDIAIDGADEVDLDNFYLIKGGGGALTREKIVDYNARKFIVIVDESKIVRYLGEKFFLPIEVLPFAAKFLLKRFKNEFEDASLRKINNNRVFITDNGGYIIDIKTKVSKPKEMETFLNNIPGVIENGIFTQNVTMIIIGYFDGTLKIVK